MALGFPALQADSLASELPWKFKLPECKWKSLSRVGLFATPVHGTLQARILEWVAFPFSRGSSQPRDQTQVYLIVGGFFTSWATREAQEYWSGQPIPSPADLPDPGIELGSPALQVDSLPTELSEKPESSLQGNLGNNEFKERSLLLDSTGSGDHRETSRAVRAHSHSFPGDSQAFKTGFSCCRVPWVLGYLQPPGGGVGAMEPLFWKPESLGKEWLCSAGLSVIPRSDAVKQ